MSVYIHDEKPGHGYGGGGDGGGTAYGDGYADRGGGDGGGTAYGDGYADRGRYGGGYGYDRGGGSASGLPPLREVKLVSLHT